MIPPTPMQLTFASSALYAELYLGLCHALMAPWLGPWPAPRAAAQAAPGNDPSALRHACAASPRASASNGGGSSDVGDPSAGEEWGKVVPFVPRARSAAGA